MNRQELREWHENNRPTFAALGEVVASTSLELLKLKNIDFLAVTHRAKSTDSLLEKVARKKYSDPVNQITDLAGIRVITYVDSDVKRVVDILSDAFTVDRNDSIDKSGSLGVDRFGYRSMHLICHVGESRASLPEFERYSGLRFEVQIRTALQHAWAEIEHDRSYKFAGELPTHLKRRFNLVAGMLELADREFDSLTTDISAYADEVDRKAALGDLAAEVNSTSVATYLDRRVGELGLNVQKAPIGSDIVEELNSFGITTLQSLDDLMSEEFLREFEDIDPASNYLGFLRDLMMYNDIQRYFEKSYRNAWTGISYSTIDFYEKKYGKRIVEELISEHGLDLIPDEF